MLFKIFLEHQWKEYTRSSIWQRNLATNSFIGLMLLLMILYLLMFGIFLDPILRKAFPDDDPVSIFNGVIIYYFGFDLLLRYMMQALPTFSIESYLHLPVSKKRIVHFVISKSIFHALNFLPLLIFLPFAIISVNSFYNPVHTLAWIISITFLILNNNFLATYLKRQLVSKPLITLAAGLLLLALAILDHFGLIKLSGVSAAIFSSFLDNPALTAIPAVLAMVSYMLNFVLLRGMMYPEEVIRRTSSEVQDIPRIKYLTSMGLTGDLIMLDLKLWLRHKRTKTILYFLPVFLLYGLIFYTDPETPSPLIYLFVGTFMIGGLNMNYLNYAFSYESNHFDGILTSRVSMDLFLRAKLTIGTLVTTFCFIMTIPYVFFGYQILLISFGVSSPPLAA
jgi:hypothetical protein